MNIKYYLLLVFICFTHLVHSKEFPGYFIDKSGNKVDAVFKVPMIFGYEEPNFMKLSSDVKYIVNEEVNTLTPGMCEKFVLTIDNREFEFIALKNKYLHGFGYSDSIFLRPRIYGPVIVYYYYYISQPNCFNCIEQGWLLEKDNGRILKVTYGGAKRKDLAVMFSDYTEFANKIVNKEIDGTEIKDTEKMVGIYNNWRIKHDKEKMSSQPPDTL
jgi:hypothetical protein